VPANWYWPVIIFAFFVAAMIWGWGGISYRKDQGDAVPSPLEFASSPSKEQGQGDPAAGGSDAGHGSGGGQDPGSAGAGGMEEGRPKRWRRTKERPDRRHTS